MRLLITGAALATAALFVSAAVLPDLRGSADPDLFASAGCATCHGPEAGGAFGPTLAGSTLTFEEFLGQLRSPRAMMPPVDAARVSDEQARILFDWVTGLEVPEGEPVEGVCRCGRHGAGPHGAGGQGCPHHDGQAAGRGQGPGAHGACRHGACSQEAVPAG